MMKGGDGINHTIQGGNPQTQYSIPFIQGMVNRMLTSFHKYGHIADAKHHVDFLASASQRVRKYQQTGNTEYLMDAANYMMAEFMHPSHEKAHYDAESRSPGRTLHSGRITDRHVEDL